MSGFVNSDGSALAGGLLPNGSGQALAFDELGDLKMAQALEAAIRAGRVYAATTGFIALPASAGNYGISIFNPGSSGVGVYVVYCGFAWNNGVASVNVNLTNADPAYANALTPANLKAGGPASVLATNVTYTNTAITPVGTTELFTLAASNATTNILPGGIGKYLPKNSGKGYAFYPYMSGGGYWGMVLIWIEI